MTPANDARIQALSAQIRSDIEKCIIGTPRSIDECCEGFAAYLRSQYGGEWDVEVDGDALTAIRRIGA